MRVRFKQFKDCKDHNIKVECTKLSLLLVLGRAHQKKEIIYYYTKKANHISIHKLPKAFVIPFPVERQPV